MIVLVFKIEQADDMGMVKLLQVPGLPFKAHDKQVILRACRHAGP
jgi:hypothetical protein